MRVWVSPSGERLRIPAKGEAAMRALGWAPEVVDEPEAKEEKKPAPSRKPKE